MEWINVKDRLPEGNGFTDALVVVTNDERVWVSFDRYDGYAKGWYNTYCPMDSFRVTHWMPLPEPPKIGL